MAIGSFALPPDKMELDDACIDSIRMHGFRGTQPQHRAILKPRRRLQSCHNPRRQCQVVRLAYKSEHLILHNVVFDGLPPRMMTDCSRIGDKDEALTES